MDYGRLNRRELQALCKEHGIPANKTNVHMAEALGALLNGPKESQQVMECVPDPAEVVKAKAKRTARTKIVTDVLEASEVDNLSSQLAKSTLTADFSELGTVEPAAEDLRAAVVEAMVAEPSEFPQSEIVPEGVKVPRRARTQTSKANTKSIYSLADSTPALVEPTLEVVLQVEDTTDSFVPTVADFAPESLPGFPFESTYSRRAPKVKESENSESVLSSATPDSVLSSEEDITATGNFAPVEEIVLGETVVAAKAVTKKSKAKGKKSKKVKPVSPISVQILADEVAPPTNGIASAAALLFPDSPTVGLAIEAIATEETRTLSPAPEDGAFEFKPVPESFAEIMTPGKPLVEATKGCQHRIGRKSGKSCRSCASEEKASNLLQEVAVPNVSDTVGVTEVDTTPLKQGDDKENSLKNIDLLSLSIRKLQKEVKRRGLAKRNNTRSVAQV